MENLQRALTEVKQIEAFMRSRYLYQHPIFAHITIAVELLEREVAAIAPPPLPEETVAELKTEETEAEEIQEIEKPEGFTQASRRARR